MTLKLQNRANPILKLTIFTDNVMIFVERELSMYILKTVVLPKQPE